MKKITLIIFTLILSVVLFACNKPEVKYTVTFNSNNGASPTSTLVTENSFVSKPEDPLKENYNFIYWSLDNENEFKFLETKITEDIELIALWQEREVVDPKTEFSVTIKFNDNISLDEVLTYKDATYIETPENPVKDGYEFIGWYLGESLFDFSKEINSSIVIEARWKKEKTEITLGETYIHNVSKDGSNADGYFVITGNLKSNPKTYMYNGELLDKAMKLESSTLISFTTLNENATLKIIAYSDKGGVFTVPGHDSVTLTTEVKEYNFNLSEAKEYIIKRNSQESQILYLEVIEQGNMPQLSDDEVLVTVIFNNNDKPVYEVINKNETYFINKNITNGLLKFDGWYTNLELTTSWLNGSIITNTLTIYAKWIEAPVYEVTADGKTYFVIEGSLVKLDEPTYILGKVFIEWWIGEEEPFDPTIPINKDYQLIAKYRDALSYTITYNLDEGTLNDPITMFYESQKLDLPTPVKEEYVFYGWYLDLELVTKVGNIANENLNLFAKWVHESEAIDFTKPVGYGKLTVGGNIPNNKVYTVTTGNEILYLLNEKREATNKGKNLANDYGLIIYINGTITLDNTDADEILVKEMGNNISFIGVGTNGELDGIGIRLFKTNQIIIQNLKIHHVLNKTGEGDAISIIDTKYVWVDHCELYSEPLVDNPETVSGSIKDKYDGLLDAKKASDYLTYSWNHFHDSYKASLNGFGDGDTYKRKITYHHNYFENLNSRLPLFRNGYGHIYNNYYKNVYTSGINSRMGAHILIESNIFENVKNPIVSLDSKEVGFWNERNNVFENITYGNMKNPASENIHHIGDPSTSDFEVDYDYLVNSTEGLKDLIINNVGVGIVN